MIVIAAMFHQAAPYVARYAAQVAALRPLLPGPSRLVLAHAQCTDGTPALLAQALPDATILDRSDGPPVVAQAVDRVDRWRSIAHTANGVLDALTDADDVLLWVESDLIWQPATPLALIGHLRPGAVDGCAAMCGYLPQGGRFYDTWGHRGLDGVGFGWYPPYHAAAPASGLMEIGSAGSAWAVTARAARSARYDDQGIVGWCSGMRAAGARLWADLDAWVWHP